MNETFALFPVAIGAFAIGSIPFGLIVGRRLFGGADIRTSGSGNIGAANALRSFGVRGGVLVLALDACKGLLPVLLEYAIGGAVAAATAMLFAVLGHCFSPWLRFRGGKGVATWLGGLVALSWPSAVAFAVVWLAIVVPTRLASLGSLAASAVAAAIVCATHRDQPAIVVCTALAFATIVVRHRENIGRLRTGNERRLEFGSARRSEQAR